LEERRAGDGATLLYRRKDATQKRCVVAPIRGERRLGGLNGVDQVEGKGTALPESGRGGGSTKMKKDDGTAIPPKGEIEERPPPHKRPSEKEWKVEGNGLIERAGEEGETPDTEKPESPANW